MSVVVLLFVSWYLSVLMLNSVKSGIVIVLNLYVVRCVMVVLGFCVRKMLIWLLCCRLVCVKLLVSWLEVFFRLLNVRCEMLFCVVLWISVRCLLLLVYLLYMFMLML